MKDDGIKFTGKVHVIFGHGSYGVMIEGGHIINCKLSGVLTKNKIAVIIGDEVELLISPYEINNIQNNKANGRITWRQRKK